MHRMGMFGYEIPGLWEITTLTTRVGRDANAMAVVDLVVQGAISCLRTGAAKKEVALTLWLQEVCRADVLLASAVSQDAADRVEHGGLAYALSTRAGARFL